MRTLEDVVLGNLRDAITGSGKTQVELSKLTGYSEKHFSMVKSASPKKDKDGKPDAHWMPAHKFLVRLAEVLGIDYSWFYTDHQVERQALAECLPGAEPVPVPTCRAIPDPAEPDGVACRPLPNSDQYVRRDWIERHTDDVNALRYVVVTSDRDGPETRYGDVVLVDLGQREPISGKVFMVRHGASIIFPRLVLGDDGGISVVLRRDGLRTNIDADADFQIVGMVIFLRRPML